MSPGETTVVAGEEGNAAPIALIVGSQYGTGNRSCRGIDAARFGQPGGHEELASLDNGQVAAPLRKPRGVEALSVKLAGPVSIVTPDDCGPSRGIHGYYRLNLVLLEILAPNFRPAQVTDDLAGFWKNMYPELKKELKRRYPKHEWR